MPAIALQGLTRLLMRDGAEFLDQKGREVCSLIEGTASRIEELAHAVDAYLAVSESPLKLEEFSASQALDEAGREFQKTMEERGVRWMQPEDLPVIFADRQAFVRVFRNLVENALKYAGEGLKNLQLGYGENETQHVFSLSDDGVGLKKEQAAAVFNLFTRGDTSRGLPGTGLGLAIVQATAQRHGGRAWLQSQPGAGCTFYFSLAKHPMQVQSRTYR